jgi:small subunit ribosomal protein S9
MKPGNGQFSINGKSKEDYLCRLALVQQVMAPLEAVEMGTRVDIRVSVKGGGVSGQAGAIRLAIARALTQLNPDLSADRREPFVWP